MKFANIFARVVGHGTLSIILSHYEDYSLVLLLSILGLSDLVNSEVNTAFRLVFHGFIFFKPKLC